MKQFSLSIKLLLVVLLILQSQGNIKSQENEKLDIKTLFSFNYDRPGNPNRNQLAIVHYILQNTFENNIHKMRGETDNVVYTNKDGREAVYDKNGNLVTNSYNRGSFNFASYDEPIHKFLLDIAPWLKWGNAKDDPTSFQERLYYYTLDLDYGIQKYIFEGSMENIKSISFNTLTDEEKEVYYIFIKLLFNDNYSIKLNNSNLRRLRSDRNYYFEYLFQIQELLGVKQ